VGTEQVSATDRILMGFDSPQLRFSRVENDCLNIQGLEQGEQFLARLADQNVWKEVTVANDYA
jgi:hypothetical protein